MNESMYSTFETKVLGLIVTGETKKLNNQELTLLIPADMNTAARSRRKFKLRFIQDHPQYSDVFGPFRRFKGRSPRRTEAELDAYFAEHFNPETARLLMVKMRDEDISVHQASGRYVAEGRRLNIVSCMLARYGEYIFTRWGVGEPSTRQAMA